MREDIQAWIKEIDKERERTGSKIETIALAIHQKTDEFNQRLANAKKQINKKWLDKDQEELEKRYNEIATQLKPFVEKITQMKREIEADASKTTLQKLANEVMVHFEAFRKKYPENLKNVPYVDLFKVNRDNLEQAKRVVCTIAERQANAALQLLTKTKIVPSFIRHMVIIPHIEHTTSIPPIQVH